MEISTSYQSLKTFKDQQVKGNKELYIYSFINTIETLTGTIKQAKVGMTTSPYQMRCYKRPMSDSIAFLAIRVHCPAFAKLASMDASKENNLELSNLAKDYEKACHNAMVAGGYSKDSETFRKENFTMENVKMILEKTLKKGGSL